MKWIKAEVDKKIDMFATITLHSFTLNSSATAEIIRIYGSHDYDIQLMVSECGKFIAAMPVKSKRKKINPQRAVTSKPIYEAVCGVLGRSFSRRVKLRSDGDVLFFKLEKTDNQ